MTNGNEFIAVSLPGRRGLYRLSNQEDHSAACQPRFFMITRPATTWGGKGLRAVVAGSAVTISRARIAKTPVVSRTESSLIATYSPSESFGEV